jgi:hypothetical protein
VAAHEANRQHREDVLVSVEGGSGVVDVVHSGVFERPVSAWLEGLSLKGTVRAADGRWHARIALAPASSAGCQPGLYDVEVDDDAGPAHVLAIVEDAVLLQDPDGRLAFLSVAGKPRPVWRLTWASTWRLYENPGTPAGGGDAQSVHAPPKSTPPGYPAN